MAEVAVSKRAQLAADLLEDAQKLRAQLFAPAVEHRAFVVSDGKDMGSHVEVVEIDMAEPTFESKRTIITAIAVAVDKLLLLDDGKTAAPGAPLPVKDQLKERRENRGADAAPVEPAVVGKGKQRARRS